MKKYYQTLTKEEKKKINNLYKKEYQNSELELRFTKLNIYAIIGYISSIIILILSFYLDQEKISSLITAITLIIVSSIFLIGKYKIKLNVLNKIALKNK